jgi:hypothetical protein
MDEMIPGAASKPQPIHFQVQSCVFWVSLKPRDPSEAVKPR